MGFLFFPIWVWGSAWRPYGPPELRYKSKQIKAARARKINTVSQTSWNEWRTHFPEGFDKAKHDDAKDHKRKCCLWTQILRSQAAFSFAVLCIIMFHCLVLFGTVGLFRSDMMLIFYMVWPWFSCGTVCVCSQLPYRGNDVIFWIFPIVPCHAFCMWHWPIGRIWIWVSSEVITILVSIWISADQLNIS